MNGYQGDCRGTSFQSTFATADQLLERDRRVSLFFDNCAFPNHPPIEDLGNEFGKFLGSLRYQDGQPVSQVDIVAHSMGGLIVRSYLAGKQTQAGVFTPPASTPVRKIVFLGTPHFGSPATSLLAGSGGDAQTRELQTGSAFTFDLATWNQGIEDLRGADAISVIGNASNGFLLMPADFGDGVTTLTSGSLNFLGAGRTRILPYCHTGGIAALVCARNSGQIAQLDSPEHQSAQILLSFLNDTPAWRSIGQAPEQNDFLSKGGGVQIRYHDAADRPQTFDSATFAAGKLTVVDNSLAFSDYVPSEQALSLSLSLSNNTVATISVPLITGATRAVTVKPGPYINGVFPSAAAIYPRSAAPGSLISLYGNQLTAATGELAVTVGGAQTPVTYADASQINTSVPDNATGLVPVTVRNGAGQHTVNLLVEPVVPALFAPAINATAGTVITTSTPLRRGDYVALFATGLGQTREQDGLQWAVVQPEVELGGQPCTVTYAGRAPGFPGLDQINCLVSMNAQTSDLAPVVVRSGGRTSNVTMLPVR